MRSAARPLQGATAWLITDGKAGHEAQAQGVAEALGLDYMWRRVAPGGLAKLLAPWGPAPADFACTPPWPAVAIGIGRTAMPALKRVHKLAGPSTFTVVLQDPHTSDRIADLIWVPAHDRRRGPNVVTTLTPPHRFTPDLLSRVRAAPDPEIEALAHPWVMVAIGGAAKVWRYTGDDIARLSGALDRIGRTGSGFLVTPSRRTPAAVTTAIADALKDYPHILYRGEGENPYLRFLAKADAIIVTADSVSMTGEALATGRPVYVFRPTGGSDKFDRYLTALESERAIRMLGDHTDVTFDWSHPPVFAAEKIARAIEERWSNRARYLVGE